MMDRRATVDDVDTDEVASDLRELADSIESGETEVMEMHVANCATPENPTVHSEYSITYVGPSEVKPSIPLESGDYDEMR